MLKGQYPLCVQFRASASKALDLAGDAKLEYAVNGGEMTASVRMKILGAATMAGMAAISGKSLAKDVGSFAKTASEAMPRFKTVAQEGASQLKHGTTKGANNTRLNTYGDALRKKLGPAYLSHTDEYNSILSNAKEMGVTIEFRGGTLAYDMELGKPGKLIIDPEASIGALRHEYRHVLDDFELGHPGMRIIADRYKFWELEFRGYLEELNLARQIKDYDAGRFILEEMRQRRREILGK